MPQLYTKQKYFIFYYSSVYLSEYLGKFISDFTDRSIERRDSFVERQKKNVNIVEDISELCYYSFSSIVNNGDAIGSVIILSTEVPITDSEEKMAVILSKILRTKK